MSKLKVTLVRSTIGCNEANKANLRGLGLRTIGTSRELENTPAVRGMIKAVMHMVSVVEVGAGQNDAS